jgi:cell division protein FtsA
VVLTGGTSKMEGVTELAEEIFHMPVRIGTPVNVKGLSDIVNNPIYSTGVGLLHFGVQEQRREGLGDTGKANKESTWDKVKGFFQGGL